MLNFVLILFNAVPLSVCLYVSLSLSLLVSACNGVGHGDRVHGWTFFSSLLIHIDTAVGQVSRYHSGGDVLFGHRVQPVRLHGVPGVRRRDTGTPTSVFICVLACGTFYFIFL